MSEDRLAMEARVRLARSRDGLERLVRALGLEPPNGVLPASDWGAFGVDRADAAAVAVGVESRGVTVLVVEPPADAGPALVARLARLLRARNPSRFFLLIMAGLGYARLTFATCGLDGEVRLLEVDPERPRGSDLDALRELAARDGEAGVALVLRHARALDRSRLTRRFFRDFRAERARIAAGWTGLADGLRPEREQLGLLLLSRLMFLYFLQKRGHLAGDADYMARLLAGWQRGPRRGSLYRDRLVPLFFEALNTRPAARGAGARALGALPFLNGGLFERHALERRFPELDLPDDVLEGAFDGLLERYRFTSRDAAEATVDRAGEAGIDPEILGQVFEHLMARDRRGATGSFYTPPAAVDRLVSEALITHLTSHSGIDADDVAVLVVRGEARHIPPVRRRELERLASELRVLDPACGSGAFLLGALLRLSRIRTALEDARRGRGSDVGRVRRDVVAHALHGVDVQDDAALICALRLWLALAECLPDPDGQDGAVPPLPNLDRRIRQGDALVDPLDLTAALLGEWRGVGSDAAVRRAVRRLMPLGRRYPSVDPAGKPALQRALAEAEAALARSWLDALERRLRARFDEALVQSTSRDLFGERPPGAARAERLCEDLVARRAELATVRAAFEDAGALPFFSFDIHFVAPDRGGFDLIVSNPPWVRAHRWPEAIRRLVRHRYEVCRHAGWRRVAGRGPAPAGSGGQVDLSLLFLERSLRLLAPGGTLAMLLPAKTLRSLYASGARRLLLEASSLVRLEDHSLDQRAIFRAASFTAVVIARKRDHPTVAASTNQTRAPDGGMAASLSSEAPGADGEGVRASPGRTVEVTMTRRSVPPLRFRLPAAELPLIPGDDDAPWLLAPRRVRAALRRMQRAGASVSEDRSLAVHRGVMTGANDVLVVREVQPKLGGLARIRAEGHERARREGRSAAVLRRYAALVEDAVLAPLVRGSDIAAWHYRAARHVVWAHDDVTAERLAPPPRLARYLARHARGGESGPRPSADDVGDDAARSGRRLAGHLRRISAATLRPKLAWHDLALTLKAVALPATVRTTYAARERPLIPLNTVYFIPVTHLDRALCLAALFNSLPLRTFARAIAERAKDARFRFFAWTISVLPLPALWDTGPCAADLVRISRAAHARGAVLPGEELELNRIVAGWYGLGDEDLQALESFDAWLGGKERA